MTAPQETSDSQPPVTESTSQLTATPPPRPIPVADPVKAGLPSLLARLWRFAMVLSHNEETAAELVQKTCLRALQRSAQFEAGTRLDRWTFSIMASLWKNELRAERIRRGGGFVEAEEALIADNREKLETQIFLNQVLTRLPEVQRSTVLLVYVEGLTYAEAAATLAVPLGTVVSRLANARLKLADMKRAEERQRLGRMRKTG